MKSYILSDRQANVLSGERIDVLLRSLYWENWALTADSYSIVEGSCIIKEDGWYKVSPSQAGYCVSDYNLAAGNNLEKAMVELQLLQRMLKTHRENSLLLQYLKNASYDSLELSDGQAACLIPCLENYTGVVLSPWLKELNHNTEQADPSKYFRFTKELQGESVFEQFRENIRNKEFFKREANLVSELSTLLQYNHNISDDDLPF